MGAWLRIAQIVLDETYLTYRELFLFPVFAQCIEGGNQLGAVGNHAAQGAHGFHGVAVGEILHGECSSVHNPCFLGG